MGGAVVDQGPAHEPCLTMLVFTSYRNRRTASSARSRSTPAGMKELARRRRRKVEAKRRQVSEEKASQEKMRRDAEAKRRQEEAQRLEADERARAQAEAEKNDPQLRGGRGAPRGGRLASSHQWKMRPRIAHGHR